MREESLLELAQYIAMEAMIHELIIVFFVSTFHILYSFILQLKT